ncbi:MAG: DUF721 domain-containing protein [Lentisphaerae bacterium]|nr:DUF721 domain-containing protein [Lentisphaerota bacterium]
MRPESKISASFPPGKRGVRARKRRYRMLAEWYGEEAAEYEIAAHTCQPRKIDDLLCNILEKIKRPENGILVRLRSEWESVIGSTFARFCEPVSLRDNILTLKVRHSILLVELKPSCDIIRDKVNQVIGKDVCTEIRLCV